MNIKETLSILMLLKIKGVGPVVANKIIVGLQEQGVGLEDLFDNNKKEVLKNWLNKGQIIQFENSDSELYEHLKTLKENNTKFIGYDDSIYPSLLKKGLKQNTPPILMAKGNLELLNKKAVGFCGSRKASERGLDVARDCAEQLAKNDITVVSGYAAGVDQHTHFTALDSGGSTIIVMPEGIMNFRVRKALKPLWDWSRVLVLSEFGPMDRWTTSRAMQRNKTIIGLSFAMILIESGKNGGSMAAGKTTLGLKKQLFAPEYEGMPDFAVGNRYLLEQGAIPLMKNKTTGRANLSILFDSMKSPATPPEQMSFI
ncbi:MAG: DNA-processing protein DprA [Bacteroidota bacterium]